MAPMGDVVMCVECRTRPVDPQWRPFCSERCKTLDLARWADGSYRIGAEKVTENDDGADTDKSEV